MFIRRDGRKSQPFGMTWEANETGTFILFAISEIRWAFNTSVASVITVIDPVGEVPQITLEEMQKNISRWKSLVADIVCHDFGRSLSTEVTF